MRRSVYTLCACVVAAGVLGGCSTVGGNGSVEKPQAEYPDSDREAREKVGTVFGDEGGITLFDRYGEKDKAAPGLGNGLGVNAYLWRAMLDTLSFMPLMAADPFGGTIITDWYMPPEVQNERFKINAFVTTQELRADGIRISVFRQVKSAEGEWVDAEAAPDTVSDLEKTVLTRARQLRVSNMGKE